MIKLAPGLSIKKSPINGRGCFATKSFLRRKKIAEYTGERISDWEAMKRARGRRHLRICDIDGRFSLDGARGGNGTHYINHSCDPNAYMQTLYGHVLFFALRDIKAGEEITLDYEQTLLPDSRRCRCGAKNCRGTINRVRNSPLRQELNVYRSTRDKETALSMRRCAMGAMLRKISAS